MKEDRNNTRPATTDQGGSSWLRVAFGSPRSIKVGDPETSDLTFGSNNEEMTLEEQPQHDEANTQGGVDRAVPNAGILEKPQVTPGQAGPFFGWNNPEPVDLPLLLPQSVPSSGGPTWTISAPVISGAIQTLLHKLNRTPTDEEIAQELFITVEHYHEALTLLRDLEFEISTQGVASSEKSNEAVVRLSGGMDCAVFVCLRSEMMRLFRNAVRSIPERELLVISLRYCEDLSDMALRLTLDIPESTLTRLSASAHFHLRARVLGSLETDHYAWGDDVRPRDAKYRRKKEDTGPEADIYMASEQRGCLPTGQPWERPGLQANYSQSSQTYFAVSDEGELKPVKRSECFQLKVEGF
jgi:hypothetical protein